MLLMHGSKIRGKRPGPEMVAHRCCLSMRPGGILWISDKAVSTIDVEHTFLRSLRSLLDSIDTLPPKDGMDDIGRVNILVAWVSVLVLVFILAVAPIMVAYSLRSVILDDLLHVDVLEVVAVLHCVIGPRMEVAWTLQGLVVVILVVMMTCEPVDAKVDLQTQRADTRFNVKACQPI